MKSPPRYLLTWRRRNDFDWRQVPYDRISKHVPSWTADNEPFIFEDLAAGTVVASNFETRDAVFFATHDWPKRKKLVSRWERYKAHLNKPKPTAADQRAKKLASLKLREKQWVTRERRAKTALRKIRRSIKHYETI